MNTIDFFKKMFCQKKEDNFFIFSIATGTARVCFQSRVFGVSERDPYQFNM